MRKEIKRTIQIGKATVEMKMLYQTAEVNLDGHRIETDKIEKLIEVKIIVDGKVIARTGDENFIRVIDSEKARFGDKYIAASAGKTILDNLAEMHEELSEERAEKVEEAKVKKVEWAKEVIKEAETRKSEILSAEQEKVWRRNYNNAENEGGEGYIPRRVTLEDVEEAKRILNIQ